MAQSDDNHKDPTDGSPKPMATFGQQVIIVILVVAVGLLFGMGPVLGVLQQPSPQEIYAGITQQEIRRQQNIAQNLQNILNPEFNPSGEQFLFRSQQQGNAFFTDLLHARLAEEEHLAPSDSQVREWFNQWQQRQVPESGQSYGQALARAQGSSHSVSPSEVQEYLKVQLAAEAYRRRHIISPPSVPPIIAHHYVDAIQQKVVVQSVTLDSAQLLNDELLAEVAADTVAIEDAYNDVRERHFRQPAKRTLTLYAADKNAVQSALQVEEAVLREAYETQADERFTMRSTDENGKEVVEIQPFAEVRDTLKQELTNDAANALTNTLAGRLRDAIIEAGLANNPDGVQPSELAPLLEDLAVDQDDDQRLSEPVGLQVVEDVVVAASNQQQPRVALADYGLLDLSEINLFADTFKVGYLSAPYRPLRNDGSRGDHRLFMLITDASPAGFTPLEEVREEVVRYVAARRQYNELLSSAQALAAAARSDGGLPKVFNEEAIQQRWNVESPVQTTLSSTERLRPPPQRWGDLPREGIPAIALGAGAEPIQVAMVRPDRNSQELWAQRPQLRLLELREIQGGASASNEQMQQIAEFRVQQSLLQQIQTEFNRQLEARLERAQR